MRVTQHDAVMMPIRSEYGITRNFGREASESTLSMCRKAWPANPGAYFSFSHCRYLVNALNVEKVDQLSHIVDNRIA
jgi:hypothetical protein